MLVLGEGYVAGQSEHFEQLDCLIVHFREDDACAALFSDVDDAEKNRYPDTINQLGIAEIYHQRAATAVELPAAFSLDLFTSQLIEIIVRINNRGAADTVRAN